MEHSREADECRHPNIEPHGDPLQPRREGDGINRFAFQNIRGTNIAKGVEIPDEIDAMERLGINVQGYAETNTPWTPGNKWRYSHMMGLRFRGSLTYYSSAPSAVAREYQPGGTVLTINGHTTGRLVDHGEDELGRFC